MTSQDVDPETYYAVAKGLFEKAGKLYDAFDVNVRILGETSAMAGTDDAGRAWAVSYNARVDEVLGAVNDLTAAMENYGGIVNQAGYNHVVAEHNATPGNKGPAPAKPAEPGNTAGVLTAPPSAGGPGKGLVDAIGLMQQVGVLVPDGDTDKIAKAADAWDRLATVHQTKTLAEGLEVDARAFRDTKSPEVDHIVQDLEHLRDATSSVLDACAELAQSCRDYNSALDDLRTQLEGILKDLAVELAVTATVFIAASFVSFGAGAVAGTAKAAQSITKFARIISEAVKAWKISKDIASGVKTVREIAGLRQFLQRLKNMMRKDERDEPATLPNVKIPETAPKSLSGYTKHAEEQIARRDGGIGVRREALEDAFAHPLRDVERLVDDQGRVSFQYTGKDATVVMNEQGRVITGWAKNTGATAGGSGG